MPSVGCKASKNGNSSTVLKKVSFTVPYPLPLAEARDISFFKPVFVIWLPLTLTIDMMGRKQGCPFSPSLLLFSYVCGSVCGGVGGGKVTQERRGEKYAKMSCGFFTY